MANQNEKEEQIIPADGNVSGVQPGARFGSVLAWGDFNGNGFGDLVVGVPNDRIGGIAAGSVNLVYGAPEVST